ncbi:MAG: hypothetical protein CW691_11130 [Candidatus Bathyarchaeum sp.]|nr:MAG: hypothetical protein CW691_11130 [Candidatus Bathyarchaeum sp.]
MLLLEEQLMGEKKLVAAGLICIVLVVGLIGALMVLNQKEAEMQIKTQQLAVIENEKNILETQVSSLQTQTSSLTDEVNTLEGQVSTLQSEKGTLEAQVTSLQSETTALNDEVGVLESQVLTLQDEVIKSYALGYSEGEFEGHQLGYDEGYVQGVEDLSKTGWYLRDPTYEEAIDFINSDTTDEHKYTPSYVCYDFTADFSRNAVQLNYRCGFVYIEFVDSAHAIACFNTTDQGLIYVEPQNDEVVTIAVGQSYLGQVVTDMGIIW